MFGHFLSSEMFNFDYTYLKLSPTFYHLQHPKPVIQPSLVLLNSELLNDMGIVGLQQNELVKILSGNEVPISWRPFAQAYAGHQFGYFNMLGDGRAIVLGEQIANGTERFDIQLKGSGPTKYSRKGDGRATLQSMLREYLISEAMNYLGIPTSRSMAVVKTGEKVQRESASEGAVLTRVMKSHIRIGTFEYARYLDSADEIKKLADYTINRLYPECKHSNHPYLSLFEMIVDKQVNLVTHWMRVGFIHGVMNTDNTSISGESFDYGPCAFMNYYNPSTVYSSIDVNSRYSFENQPNILKWNLCRLAESLIPIVHHDQQIAVDMLTELINDFDRKWKLSYNKMMLAKIGLDDSKADNIELVSQLCSIMETYQLDYTNTFRHLTYHHSLDSKIDGNLESVEWMKKWKEKTHDSEGIIPQSKKWMMDNNPVLIPRNHLVEQAIKQAADGDISLFSTYCEMIKNPYQNYSDRGVFVNPPSIDYEHNYKTYCGT
jgi:uncharacterized protein YdiU (UPF0061 family)